MENCIFCKIAAGEIPAKVVDSNDFAIAFLDVAPKTEGHTLVIPRQHAETLADIDEATLAEVIKLVKRVAKAQVAAVGADGCNILQNNGAAAGQVVKHIHFHILPRFAGKKIEMP